MLARSLAATLAALLAAPAAATILVSTGHAGGPAGDEQMIADFDRPLAAGVVWDGAPLVSSRSQAGVALAPLGSEGRFALVSSRGPRVATLLMPAQASVSLLWGSIDAHNSIEVLDRSLFPVLRLTGRQLLAMGGGRDRRVRLDATDGAQIGGLRFFAGGIAFEFDSIAVARPAALTTAAAVPEPQSWALMLGGFGLVGMMARRRRAQTACGPCPQRDLV